MADLDDFEIDSRSRGHPGHHAMAALAKAQHGVVALRQLLELGIGRGAIKHWLRTGRLHRVHIGVYAVGHSALRSHGGLMAAVLACGPDALVSHRDAAWLWGLLPPSGSAIDVTVPGRGRRARAGMALHCVRRLHPSDRAEREAIPVTALPRTLLDLAEVLRPRQLERAIEESERLRLFDLRAIEELCARSRGRRGLRSLRALLAEVTPSTPATRSELERRFLVLCRKAGLPQPAVNVCVAGHEVDAFWPDRRLVVELDGYAYHGGRAAFEKDRIRDAALQLAGCRVLRITHRRLDAEPAAVAEAVRSLLRDHPSASATAAGPPRP